MLRFMTISTSLCLLCTPAIAQTTQFPAQTTAKVQHGNVISGVASMPHKDSYYDGLRRVIDTRPKTCAGSTVALFASSPATLERMQFRYGNLDRGFLSHKVTRKASKKSRKKPPRKQSPAEKMDRAEQARFTDPLLPQQMAPCDATGRFTFSNLADGEYFVTSKIVWGEESNQPYGRMLFRDGGEMMTRVRVTGGQSVSIALLP